GIGDERRPSAEEIDAGKLAELIVERDGGGGGERVLAQDSRSGGAFEIAQRGAIGGDGDLLHAGCELEMEGYGRGKCEGLRSETRGGDADDAGRSTRDGIYAGWAGAAQEMIR